MATYAIGDVQGCYDELQALLAHIQFDAQQDRLWLTGDIVNRGPKSLETLRFLSQLKPEPIIVLGNHDLHLLARAAGVSKAKSDDTLKALLNAPDCDALCNWLRHRPLLHFDQKLNFVMVHAGLLPNWDLPLAQACAHELESQLRGPNYSEYFANMYGNKPDCWQDDLSGWGRLRLITNVFTRMRYCSEAGKLSLKEKGAPPASSPKLMPWFAVPTRRHAQQRILFGHWASLMGASTEPNCFALDTGCVWGGSLTAMRLEDLQLFSVAALTR